MKKNPTEIKTKKEHKSKQTKQTKQTKPKQLIDYKMLY